MTVYEESKILANKIISEYKGREYQNILNELFDITILQDATKVYKWKEDNPILAEYFINAPKAVRHLTMNYIFNIYNKDLKSPYIRNNWKL